MKPIAQQGLSRDEVISILKGERRSRKINFLYRLLDRQERFKKNLDGVYEADIKHSALATDIKSTFSFSLKEDISIDYLNDRIQPVVRFEYDGLYLEWAMGIFLLNSPKRYEDTQKVFREVTTYDKLQILLDDLVAERYMIAEGTNYIQAIRNLILSTNESKINIENSTATLSTAKEWEIGTPKLRIINELLSDLNFEGLWVDENGFYTSRKFVLPADRPTEFEYSDGEFSVLCNGITEELDLFSVPNKFVVTASNPEQEPLISVYTNENPASLTSTINRGRTITSFQQVDSIADQTALNDYTQMIAYNASQVYGYVEFETAIMPFHSHMDTVRLRYSPLGINDRYSETEWSFRFAPGERMKHRARKVIQI